MFQSAGQRSREGRRDYVMWPSSGGPLTPLNPFYSLPLSHKISWSVCDSPHAHNWITDIGPKKYAAYMS